MSKHIKLPTLLVIADNPTIRFWIKKHLDDQFFILTAEKRKEALDALNARLDFIILDSEFEGALDLCKELSQMTHKAGVPILLITGRLKKSYREKALESGVFDFLSDQLDLEELEIRIAEGKKSASARQRTEEIGQAIKTPKSFDSSLKNRQVKRNDK